MFPPGHLAINLLLIKGARKIYSEVSYVPALVAAILPDIIDKTFHDYGHLFPYGRNIMHNLTAVLVGGVLIFFLSKKKTWSVSWMIGHFGHLLGDISFIPWFWPWLYYKWPADALVLKESVQMAEAVATDRHFWEIFSQFAWFVPWRIFLEIVFFSLTLGFVRSKNSFSGFYLVSSLFLWFLIFWKWDLPAYFWNH